MYKSTDSAGKPAAVTGAYLEPTARWSGPGPRPLVALAPGTMGQGDACAASKALENPLSIGRGSVSVGYENLAAYRLLAKGVAVVVTDYIGLGTTDRVHTYINRVDEGHAVLDAVRAARALPGTSITGASAVGLFGYSQGGQGTAAAAELQPSYAPDVKLAGAYAGAPLADLSGPLTEADGTSFTAAIAWSTNGFVQAYPQLKPIVDKYLNAKGEKALKDASTMCTGDGIFAFNGQKSSSWTKTGQSMAEIVEAEPELRKVFAEQRIGNLTPDTPVRVANGVNDNLVPFQQARRLAADWCARGASVSFVPVEVPALPVKLLNHFLPMLSDQGTAINWVTDRLAGKAATANCQDVTD
ncbi:lipase family protein [Streptomyces gilvus]|uniref:lipase family protein n=1 Tax=Streptomyces gilvus TaxID=2920937 RepID=UPI001F0F5632|nr:lipase family protein [Streptomyces sp. CME 23]MCH5672869.1 lipase family protein [Streptomyces sp. CME 23]